MAGTRSRVPSTDRGRRWLASLTMIGDLTKVRAIAAAALESTQRPKVAGAIEPEDRQAFYDLMTSAVDTLDRAIVIAERNRPKSKPVSEELPRGL